MKTWKGDLIILKGMDLEQFRDLEEITGDLDIYAAFSAPMLSSVGGGLSVEADFSAPALTSVGGSLSVRADFSAPALTSVGGSLSVRADFSAPALTSVGGDLSVEADFSAPNLPYCPDGKLIGWKKCRKDVMVRLEIPEDADRVGLSTGKCRASYARVLEVIGAELGVSKQDETFVYRVGETVRPDSFDKSLTTCSNGIHFFLTREQAEKY